MNLPNKLSVARIVAVPFFLAAMLASWPGPSWALVALRGLALALFIAAAATDWFDGWYARRHNLKTRLGALIDPLADKILVAAALVALVEVGLLWAWVVALILAREFLVTGLRLVAAAEGVVISADRWGKHKTAWQMTSIALALAHITVAEAVALSSGPDAADGLSPAAILRALYLATMAVAVVLTIVSGWVYVSRHRDLLKE